MYFYSKIHPYNTLTHDVGELLRYLMILSKRWSQQWNIKEGVYATLLQFILEHGVDTLLIWKYQCVDTYCSLLYFCLGKKIIKSLNLDFLPLFSFTMVEHFKWLVLSRRWCVEFCKYERNFSAWGWVRQKILALIQQETESTC